MVRVGLYQGQTRSFPSSRRLHFLTLFALFPLYRSIVFHPKQKAWHEYLSTSKTLETINDNSRIAFALCYVATRVLYFPVLIFRNVVPDCWTLAHESPELATPLYVLLVLSILFTFLQLYWGSLIIRQIIKAVSGGDSETKKKKE